MIELETEDFLQNYLQLNAGTEIPPIFALWCGIAGISCALGRRCWIDFGMYNIFPNMFIVLVAGSGKCRKSAAVEVIEPILRQIQPPPNLLPQSVTREALIDSLNLTETSDPKRLLKKNCTGFVLADELSTFMYRNSYDPEFMTLLIQCYDCKSVYEYKTKLRGSEKLTDVCLGILGGTTVDLLKKAIPSESIGSGLTSRIVFVYWDIPMKGVAIPEYGDKKKKVVEKVVRKINKLSQLSGKFQLSQETKRLYVDVYNSFRDSSKFFDDKNLAAYASRRHNHLLKVAMIFSASESEDMIIHSHHFDKALGLLEESEANMPEVLMLASASEIGLNVYWLSSIIKSKGEITRSTLLTMVSHKIPYREFEDAMVMLMQSKQIKVAVVNGTTTVYKWAK